MLPSVAAMNSRERNPVSELAQDLCVRGLRTVVVPGDVVDDHVDALVHGAELTRRPQAEVVRAGRAQHDHPVAEPQLRVRDLAVRPLVYRGALESERSLEPIDCRRRVLVAQKGDAVHPSSLVLVVLRA